MYIVKDESELVAGRGVGNIISFEGVDYTFADSTRRIFTGQVTDMSSLFENDLFYTGDIGYWDTSRVTDMSGMFRTTLFFNRDISGWDTSRVTNMAGMFQTAYGFNQVIGDWDTSSVTDMDNMFFGAGIFNQDIGGWDTSNVTNMAAMFQEAIAFNQDLSPWNVSLIPSKPTDFDLNATAWSNDPAWRPQWGTAGIPAVVSLTSPDADGTYGAGDEISVDVRFTHAITISDPGGAGPPDLTLETGATDAVATYVSGDGTDTLRFAFTVSAGQYSPDLDVASTTALNLNGLELLNGTTAANLTLHTPGAAGSLGANKALVIDTRTADCYDPANAQTVGGAGWIGDCEGMYIVKDKAELGAGVTAGNKISFAGTDYTFADGPNLIFTGQVTDMSELFRGNPFFNGDIGYWDTSGVTDMSLMFYEALSFNQDIGGWDTSSVTGMPGMFGGATAFNHDLSAWNVSLIPTEPSGFDYNALAWTNDPAWRPQWGTQPPVVTSVDSPTADGANNPGDTIDLTVAFDVAVNVTGTPQIMLETGATDRLAS